MPKCNTDKEFNFDKYHKRKNWNNKMEIVLIILWLQINFFLVSAVTT